jgi:zinc/manganese transport system ATP-binding protein
MAGQLEERALAAAPAAASNDRDHAMNATPPALAPRRHARTGGRTILRDVSFSIEPGEFVGVLGPNGAGKTTLMRAVLGLVPLSGGTLSVGGVRPRAATRRSATCRRSERPRESPDARLRLRRDGGRRPPLGLPHASAATRRDVDRVLELVGATTLGAPAAVRAVGRRAAAPAARAMPARQPKLLLLDEPLISLDPNHQRGVVELVRNVQRELGITVLFSAHELNPLLNALDRVLYLGNGVAALGTVDEVITKPVLSRLYGSPIDVMRVNGKIFVMSGDVEIEKHDHEHEHDDGHAHGRGAHAHQHHGTRLSRAFARCLNTIS